MPRHGGNSGMRKADKRRRTFSQPNRWTAGKWEDEMNEKYVKRTKERPKRRQ